jgi:acetyl-CoA acetyltransferase
VLTFNLLPFPSIGPAYAIPKALSNAGITDADVDFYEINGVSPARSLICRRPAVN